LRKQPIAKRPPARLAWVGALLWCLSFHPSEACTLWGAVGDAVAGGGALVAKNRDWVPDHRQELVLLAPPEGYRAVALRAVGNDEPGIKAGVNEKGLVIVSAAADQFPSADRKKIQQKKELMRHFLTTCASVAELLTQIELMRRPVFYLAGDRTELAVIEVAPGGRRSITRTVSGTLHHTNHFCGIEPPELKRKPGASSRLRDERIEELLKTPGRPFDLEEFIRFSEDRNAGPDNSIRRTGSAPGKPRTLATWVVSVPPFGSPQLFLRTADPGEPERICRLSVAEALRLNGGERIPLNAGLCSGPSLEAFNYFSGDQTAKIATAH
jgi:isopenicillin-N N-acyltransferase like protein